MRHAKSCEAWTVTSASGTQEDAGPSIWVKALLGIEQSSWFWAGHVGSGVYLYWRGLSSIYSLISWLKYCSKKYLPMGKGGGQRIPPWLKHPIESLTFRKLGNSQGASQRCACRPLWPLPPKTQTCSKPKETQRYLPSMCFHFGRWHIKNRRWFPKGSVWLVWKKGAFHWLDLHRAGALKARVTVGVEHSWTVERDLLPRQYSNPDKKACFNLQWDDVSAKACDGRAGWLFGEGA